MHAIVQLWDWSRFDDRVRKVATILHNLADVVPSFARKKQLLKTRDLVYEFIDAPYIKNIPLPSPFDDTAVEDMPIIVYIKTLNAILIAFDRYLHRYTMKMYTSDEHVSSFTAIDPSFDLYQASLLFTRANIVFCYDALVMPTLRKNIVQLDKTYTDIINQYIQAYEGNPPLSEREMYEYMFSQYGRTLDIILILLTFPNDKTEGDSILTGRLLMFLMWFADGVESVYDIRQAARRVKKYVINNKGFLGIIDESVANKYIYDANKKDNAQYFIIGIDLDNINTLVLYTQGDKRPIKGNDLEYIYSSQYLAKPYPYASFSIVPLNIFKRNIRQYYDDPI